MKLLFIIIFVKSNFVDSSLQIFRIAIRSGNLSWLFTVRIYRSYLPWKFATVIYHGFLLWRFSMDFYCGNSPRATCGRFWPWEFCCVNLLDVCVFFCFLFFVLFLCFIYSSFNVD